MSVVQERGVRKRASAASAAGGSTWMALTVELWLIVALGLATGVMAMLLYGRVADLERRVDALEGSISAIESSAHALEAIERT